MADEAAVNVMRPCCCCLRRGPHKALRTCRGNLEVYEVMLKDCFNIQIIEGNEECGICKVCMGRLRDASAFKSQVERSQAELKALLDMVEKGESRVKSEPLESLDDDSQKDRSYERSNMEMSVEREDNGARKEFLLHEGHVKLEALEEDNKEDGMSSALSSRERDYLTTTSAATLQRLRGDETPSATHTKQSPDNTTRLTEEETYTCNNCGRQLTRESSLGEHIQQRVTGATYYCKICSEKLSSRTFLTKHERTLSARMHSYENTKKFTTQSCLLRDVVIETGEKPYNCGRCNKKFAQEALLAEHKQIHTGDKLFSCEICDLKFGQKSSLRKHKLRHTGDKPYSCDIYNLRFGQKNTLTKHKHVHTGDKTYSCEICDELFTNFGDLTKHTLIHSDLIFYGCETCQKKFTTIRNLECHKKSHTNVKPFSCGVCKMKFKRERNLNKHKKVHLRIKPYSCEICKRKYKQQKGLKKHNKKNHKVSDACNFK